MVHVKRIFSKAGDDMAVSLYAGYGAFLKHAKRRVGG
jgi:hypothetical protein